MTQEDLKKSLPNLTDPKLLERLLEKGQLSTFEPGKTLMEPGQFVKAVPLVLDGSIKIMRMDEDGNVSYLVSWQDAAEVMQERWFDEDQLTAE